jgi:hypothetical protein
MSVNKTAMQKRLPTPFYKTLGGRGALWTNWPTDVLEIVALY